MAPIKWLFVGGLIAAAGSMSVDSTIAHSVDSNTRGLKMVSISSVILFNSVQVNLNLQRSEVQELPPTYYASFYPNRAVVMIAWFIDDSPE